VFSTIIFNKNTIGSHTTTHLILVTTGIIFVEAWCTSTYSTSKESVFALVLLLGLTKAAKILLGPVDSILLLAFSHYINMILWIFNHVAHRLVRNFIFEVNSVVIIQYFTISCYTTTHLGIVPTVFPSDT